MMDNSRLHFFQIREQRASQRSDDVTITDRHLVLTEIRDLLPDDEFAVDVIAVAAQGEPFRTASLWLKSRRIAQEADGLIASQGVGLRLAALSAAGLSISPIITISYDPFPSPTGLSFRSVLTPLRRRLYREMAAVLVNSRLQAKWLASQIGKKNVHFIPMSVDLEAFKPSEGPKDDFLFMTDGGLRDYATLARAIAVMPTKPRRLMVVHRAPLGELARESLARIEASGTRVETRFRVSRAELVRLYQACLAVVIPLKDSMQPAGLTQLLEAGAAGCPIVISSGPFLTDHLTPGEAVIHVAPGDVFALAESLQSVVTQPELRERLSDAVLTEARAYSFDRSVRALRDVLGRISANRQAEMSRANSPVGTSY